MRRFANDAEGHWYGEQRLGPTRDNLPPSEFRELHSYTQNSWINNFFRNENPRRLLEDITRDHDLHRHLTWILGSNQMPAAETLHQLLRIPNLSDYHRHILSSILSSPNPHERIREIWDHSFMYHDMWRIYGEPPTLDVLGRHIEGLDRALSRELPERMEAIRGLRDVSFMTLPNGTQLGDRDPRELIGTTQTESGYMSSSLGATPPPHFNNAFRMELDLPPGTRGAWMGMRSAYPDQRELILPRGTRYQIVDVIPNPQGERYAGVQFLIRARVIPSGSD